MKQDTKHIIIEAGARIIHRKGYNHTGIQEVLKAAGVPKGSFYFYFKNKEDFGLHVIDYFETMVLGMVKPIVSDTSLSPLGRISGIFDYYIHLFEEVNYTCGCPIGNLAQEMGDLSDAFSSSLQSAVKNMARVYREILDEAQSQGEFPSSLNTEETAEFIVTSWHGALIKMKIDRSIAPLTLHKQIILGLIRA